MYPWTQEGMLSGWLGLGSHPWEFMTSFPRLSSMYVNQVSWICLKLLTQTVLLPSAFAWASVGSKRAARIAMIAITTKSSIRVKPLRRVPFGFIRNNLISRNALEMEGLPRAIRKRGKHRELRTQN